MSASLLVHEAFDNPYPAYRAAQTSAPMQFDATYKGWVLTRYKDVDAVLKDPAVFSSEKPLNALPTGLGAKLMLLSHDPPEHAHLRTFVQKSFTTSSVGKLREWVAQQADVMLDRFEGKEMDFVADIAIPFPIHVLNRVLGLPPDRWDALRQWTQNAAQGEHGSANYPSRKSLLDLYGLFRTEFLDPSRIPQDGLLAALTAPNSSGRRLSPAEVMSFCMTLHIVGNETVANMLGTTLSFFVADPGLWQRARADRRLVEQVIEESMRFESPVQFVSRRVMKPVTICGRLLQPGERVLLCLGAANRDPEVFADPDRFEPTRKEAQHFAFGRGIHFCLGAILTRMESAILFNRMLDRYSSLQLCGDIVTNHSAFFRGLKSLPVRCEAPTH